MSNPVSVPPALEAFFIFVAAEGLRILRGALAFAQDPEGGPPRALFPRGEAQVGPRIPGLSIAFQSVMPIVIVPGTESVSFSGNFADNVGRAVTSSGSPVLVLPPMSPVWTDDGGNLGAEPSDRALPDMTAHTEPAERRPAAPPLANSAPPPPAAPPPATQPVARQAASSPETEEGDYHVLVSDKGAMHGGTRVPRTEVRDGKVVLGDVSRRMTGEDGADLTRVSFTRAAVILAIGQGINVGIKGAMAHKHRVVLSTGGKQVYLLPRNTHVRIEGRNVTITPGDNVVPKVPGAKTLRPQQPAAAPPGPKREEVDTIPGSGEADHDVPNFGEYGRVAMEQAAAFSLALEEVRAAGDPSKVVSIEAGREGAPPVPAAAEPDGVDESATPPVEAAV